MYCRPQIRAWRKTQLISGRSSHGRKEQARETSDPRQLGVLGDEFLRPGAIEVDGQLRLRSLPFHRQDRSVAELFVAHARAALELRGARRFRARRADRRWIELNGRVLE